MTWKLFAGLIFVFACSAQTWEIGALGGYSWTRDLKTQSPTATGTAGIDNKGFVGLFISENLYEYLSGEFRYSFHDGDPFVHPGFATPPYDGHAHDFVYDLVFHFRRYGEKLRPFAAVGAGARWFRYTVVATPQTKGDEWRFLTDFGGGVKYRLHRHVSVRAEMHYNFAPFPRKLLETAPGASTKGFMHMIAPSVGVSYVF